MSKKNKGGAVFLNDNQLANMSEDEQMRIAISNSLEAEHKPPGWEPETFGFVGPMPESASERAAQSARDDRASREKLERDARNARDLRDRADRDAREARELRERLNREVIERRRSEISALDTERRLLQAKSALRNENTLYDIARAHKLRELGIKLLPEHFNTSSKSQLEEKVTELIKKELIKEGLSSVDKTDEELMKLVRNLISKSSKKKSSKKKSSKKKSSKKKSSKKK
jgi:hypothetical protein